MKKCKGCGSILQTEDKEAVGYVKSLDQEYCMSCFRLKNYRDFKRVQVDVNDSDTLEFIEGFDGHILWVVDVLRLSQSLHSGLIRSLRNKKVVLLINKMDLIPKATSIAKIRHNIMGILKDEAIQLQDIVFISSKKKETLEELIPYLKDDDCAFIGSVNAGKSSLLNALFNHEVLSVSPVASTTASVIEIDTEYGSVFDTPGLRTDTSLSQLLNDEQLVGLAPQKTLKPQVFQLYEPQALILGNIGTIMIYPEKSVNVISYIPIELKRVKIERVDANLALAHPYDIDNPQYKTRIIPNLATDFDIEFFDLGFVNIKGKVKRLEIKMDKRAEYAIRRSLI